MSVPQPILPPPVPEPWQGSAILSDATERLREEYVTRLRNQMEQFYKLAGLAEIMFLNDAVENWEANYAGVITRRCPIADVLLSNLGYGLEEVEPEQIRHCEYDVPNAASATAS